MQKNKKILKLLNQGGNDNFSIYDAAKKIIFHEENLRSFLMSRYIDVKPITAEIVTSLECNFNCPACTYFQNKAKLKGKKGHRFLNEKVYKRMLDELRSFGVKSLIFTGGGEPSMHPELISFIGKAINNFKIGVYTNGLLWNKKKIYDLLSLNPSFVRISVNAGTAEVHKKVFGYGKVNLTSDKVFSKINKNIVDFARIKKELNSKTVIGTSFIINEKNICDMENIFLFLQKIYKKTNKQIDHAAFRPEVYYMDDNCQPVIIQPNSGIFRKSVSEIEKYIEPKEGKNIPKIVLNKDGFLTLSKKYVPSQNIAASWSISFNFDGKVYFTSEHNGVEKYCLGDISKATMAEIWYGEKRKYLLNNINTLPNFKLKTLNDLLLKIRSLGKFSEEEVGEIMKVIKKNKDSNVHNYFF